MPISERSLGPVFALLFSSLVLVLLPDAVARRA
jgi:hypothetical protein